jgi:hypothetical protein
MGAASGAIPAVRLVPVHRKAIMSEISHQVAARGLSDP